MGLAISLLGVCFWANLFLFCFAQCLGESVEGTVLINGNSSIARTDEQFICATLDWWPPTKCDYGRCSWGLASVLNLDLNNKIFMNAVRAFKTLKIRVGGTLQDKVIYENQGQPQSCNEFVAAEKELFGFTQGCLPMRRWDELCDFFKKSGASVVFGLNALSGRSIASNGSAVGAWDSTNARSFINYTATNGCAIHGWELGNELSGKGVGTRVAASQYITDAATLKTIVDDVYIHSTTKPLTIAPGGFYDEKWFGEFISATKQSVNAITHHIYNLGSGASEQLVDHILDPNYLDGEASTFKGLQKIIMDTKTHAVAWVGESGGAYNSGHDGVSNAFVYSIWYVDQLGMSSAHNTKTYCRQSLVGGNYGLLDTSDFKPNPDYYSALLWHRLMGRNVLSTKFAGTKTIRVYTHCAKQSKGITLVLINLDGSNTVEVTKIEQVTQASNHAQGRNIIGQGHSREEYHLTGYKGDLRSRTMVLNDKNLSVNSREIPLLEPLSVKASKPISVAPFSIVFAHMPGIVLPACQENFEASKQDF